MRSLLAECFASGVSEVGQGSVSLARVMGVQYLYRASDCAVQAFTLVTAMTHMHPNSTVTGG